MPLFLLPYLYSQLALASMADFWTDVETPSSK